MRAAINLRIAIIVIVVLLGFGWQVYSIGSVLIPRQVYASVSYTNNIMERVRVQPMTFGTLYIYACVDTRIGYTAVVNNQGILYSWERMTNVMGEPQRFDSYGNVLERLDKENWYSSGQIRGRLVPQPDGSLLLVPDNRPGWIIEWEHESPNVYPSIFPNQ